MRTKFLKRIRDFAVISCILQGDSCVQDERNGSLRRVFVKHN